MKKNMDVLIKNGHCWVWHENDLVPQTIDIGIANGVFVKIGSQMSDDFEITSETQIIDAENLEVFPGLIDTQVHFREPGMIHKETIESGSKSALLGGITAYFEMPNTKPPTTTYQALEEKCEIARNTSWTHWAFYGGASPDNLADISEMEKHPHCSGIKIFMGSSTGTLLVEEEEHLKNILRVVQRRVAVHCEDEARLNERKQLATDVTQHPIWRDELTGLYATQKLVSAAMAFNKAIHVLHITSKNEVEYLAKMKKEFSKLSCEVLPQHLTLAAPECYEKLGALAQQNPPIRDLSHQAGLWQGLKENVFDIFGSDHAPHTLEEKAKSYPQTPSGMPGVQTILPILFNHVNEGRLELKKMILMMSENPRKLFKIKNKGRIELGFDADLTIVDLKKEVVLTNEMMATRSGWTPFHQKKIKGFPQMVFLNGRLAMRDQKLIGNPSGQGLTFEDAP